MIWAFVTRHPRAVIAVALALALLGWLWWHDRQIIAQDRMESRTQALDADARADDAAGRVAASQAAQVERTNDEARNAATTGTDPLGDGLRSLRANKDRNGKAAR